MPTRKPASPATPPAGPAKPKPTARPAAPRAPKAKASAALPPDAAPLVAAAPEAPERLAPAAVAVAATKPSTTKLKTSRAAEQRARTARRASVLLKFVSDPTRLQVILFLAEAEHHVGALCEQLGQTQPAVSHHLALLRHGGIIYPRRLGKNNFYSLSDSGSELAKVVKLLLQTA